MDKKAIKIFAIESRRNLMEEVKYQASLLGITAECISDPVKKAEGMEVYDIGAGTPNTIYDDTIKQRQSLVKRVKEKGFDNVVEEVAYTWFNRIIAIRFMEVNDYLPNRVRVLSSVTEGKIEPEIVTEAPNVDLNLTNEEIKHIYQLKNDNKLDELFKLLFIKQCNKLNEILPELFEKTLDYTELLLSISFTNDDGVVRQLIDNISEEDFMDQVEIIGWLYQYYNTELKDDTFKQLKKRVKISKERIPAATQLFTPNWIVRYMVENSLGRLWLEGHPDSPIKENWKYYFDEAEQEPEVQIELVKIKENSKKLKPEDIKIIDPAMGSGHILVYAFDVLMQIYKSVGYSENDASVSILENNLYGLDIDDRAYQLAYFAMMMKGRSYNRRILNKNIDPQICAIQESNRISVELIDFVAEGNLEVRNDLLYIKETFKNSKEYGSILNLRKINLKSVLRRFFEIKEKKCSDFISIKFQEEANNILNALLKQQVILSNKYQIVVTNPPYMGNKSINKGLSKYLKTYFPNCKNDLFAVFIEKCLKMLMKNGYLGMITQHSFMFLTTYEKLRKEILSKNIVNMLHLGARAFEEIGGEVVQTASFIIKNNFINNYKSSYSDLLNYKSEEKKKLAFLKKNNIYITNQNDFFKIPGEPIAYWVSEKIFKAFETGTPLGKLIPVKKGMDTGNNAKYLRFWYEVNYLKTIMYSKNFKWVSYNKGGSYRKWYGNNEYIINWENDGEELKNSKANIRSKDLYFKPSITWSALTTGNPSFRFSVGNTIFDSAGSSMFPDDEKDMMYYLALMNSKITQKLLFVINPTLNYGAGSVSKLPIIQNKGDISTIIDLSKKNINICKEDWDLSEISWDFSRHPLLKDDFVKIKDSYNYLKDQNNSLIKQIKQNEEVLNQIFIDIYNLSGEISPDLDELEISIPKIELNFIIKSFISFAIGCMFGRYSLDEEGLVYAGGQWDLSKYSKFIPDNDNIIPILDTEYFEDDIVGKFVEFVKITFGVDTLEENIDFIASALEKKGDTSREIIRNYLLNDFFINHCNLYSSRNTGKRPIYWQFDSGKNNGFKALIYMHRYEPDIVARVRTDYLHKTQKKIDAAIAHNDRIIESTTTAQEKSNAVKTKNKLIKQMEEIRKYDEALAHIANQKIEIDLDDGVKVNYAKFQGVEVSKKGKKTIKIDLLKKI